MRVKDDFSRHAWVYFSKKKSDAAHTFREFLADVHADGAPPKVEIVRSDKRGGVIWWGVWRRMQTFFFCSKQKFTHADSPKQDGVVERELGIIHNAGLAACIQATILFPRVQPPPTKSLWAEACIVLVMP